MIQDVFQMFLDPQIFNIRLCKAKQQQKQQENQAMQLRFLGQTYSADNNQVETTASEYTARFRGQSYTIPIPTQIVKSQLSKPQLSVSVRKYRGVYYIVETKAQIAK